MLALRLQIAVVLGSLFTTSMFWLLWHLVGGAIDVDNFDDATRIDFTRMRRDTEVQIRRQEKVERERPPQTPQTPRLTVSNANVTHQITELVPVLNTRGAMTGMRLTAGSDRDSMPLVRIPPEYPPRALARGQEGWVIVQFTITPIGTVKDAIVIESDPPKVFDDAALKAIARWRYNPRVEGSVEVERVGMQTKIIFELNE